MPARTTLCLLLSLTLLAACDSDPEVSDGAVARDASAPPDTGTGAPDAGPDDAGPPDAGSSDAGGAPDAGPADAGSADAGDADAGDADGGAPDGGSLDAGSEDGGASDAGAGDAGASDAGTFEPGLIQCRRSADCSGPAAFCSRSAPGGVCVGCGNDTDCPGGLTCSPTGACIVDDCDTDADCNAGFRCNSGTHRCGIRSCTLDEQCAPYDCAGGSCARWSCAGGLACPSPFVCDSGLCIEP